jgi:hypothetical protein
VPTDPLRQRVGWLLRTNRRLGQDEAMQAGNEFARAFHRDGERPLPASQVTRWENGSLQPGRRTIRRYEDLLGLAPYSLVALSDAINRLAGAAGPTRTSTVDPSGESELHQLLDQALAEAAMTGPRWLELSELVQARPGLVLHPPRLWGQLCDRLLAELVVAKDSAWLQRQEAMCRLLEHPVAAPHAVAACIRLAEDPSNPVVIEPLSLLDVTAYTGANQYILRAIEAPASDRALRGALLAAQRKIRDGHYAGDDLVRLASTTTWLLTDPSLSPGLRPLVHDVGRILQRRLPGAANLRRLVQSSTDEGARQGSGLAPISRRVGALVQAGLPLVGEGSDATLATLIDEAVDSPNFDQQLYAGMLLAATPIRDNVAEALLSQLRAELRSRHEAFPVAALAALTAIGANVHRPVIRDILLSPGASPAIRRAAAWATPHCSGSYPIATWRAVLQAQFLDWRRAPAGIGTEILHGITYGIGTDNHADLLVEIYSDEHMPTIASNTASWFLHGPKAIAVEA